MPRNTYVWRLAVTLPDTPPNRIRADWPASWPLPWPQRRKYLTLSGAEKAADYLRRMGATKVTISRSEPVFWPED